MRVFMLRNPGSHMGCLLREKETGIVSDRVGQAIIAAGIAVRLDEPVQEPEPVVAAIPVPPAIAEAEEPAVEAVPEPPPIAEAKEPESTAEPKPAESIPPEPRAAWSPAKAPVLQSRKPKNKES